MFAQSAISAVECAFWDFAAVSGRGNWSTNGCRYNGTRDGRVICLCDHMTNFAILTVSTLCLYDHMTNFGATNKRYYVSGHNLNPCT